MADIIIIGAGVTGTAIARELSRYQREILVLERAADVCEGTSKANSGIVHAGHDALPGTLKARLNVEGNKRMEQLSGELDFPFKRNGALVLCFREQDEAGLGELLERGRKNGVEGLQILSANQVRSMEPGISEQVYKALYAPTGGMICPFGLNIALAENAYENGVTFCLQTQVKKIEKPQTGKLYRVLTNKGCFEAPIVINGAGVYADVLHNMVSSKKLHITARKGEYCLLDKEVGGLVSKTLFQLPTKTGKGALVTPTVHGNLLVGPTAMEVEDKEAVNTTGRGIDQVLMQAEKSVNNLPTRSVITSFAGLRAHGDHVNHDGNNDFLIQEAEDAPGFIDVAGIESPGLTCAPAIGAYVADMVQQIKPALLKSNFLATRKGIPNMYLATEEERLRLIKSNPAFANVICRCEQVTEGEILAAIHRPLGATTVDGVKRRTRAGMGRCQAGFCLPKTVEILARELSEDISQITKSGEKSVYLTGRNKETERLDCAETPQITGRGMQL
ncbi:MAG TPA: NAD(P)/FAD-dependent oxidoreductase [Lachnospiraceae bacterium]|nr:NAD(P)/FAD-dependent oxidoreductase [Lachnospiraceae bacterium]